MMPEEKTPFTSVQEAATDLKGDDAFVFLCRLCGNDLPPGAQRRLGVCVWCVADTKYTARRIPTPRYGPRS